MEIAAGIMRHLLLLFGVVTLGYSFPVYISRPFRVGLRKRAASSGPCDLDVCKHFSTLCLNGGTCVMSRDCLAACVCPAGYTGFFCNVKVTTMATTPLPRRKSPLPPVSPIITTTAVDINVSVNSSVIKSTSSVGNITGTLAEARTSEPSAKTSSLKPGPEITTRTVEIKSSSSKTLSGISRIQAKLSEIKAQTKHILQTGSPVT